MLRDARVHIQKVGWAKGTEQNSSGAVCLHRALKDVDGTKHPKAVDDEARRVILHHVPLSLKTSIPTFNDAQSTTQQDVLDLLLACEMIEREMAGG